MAAAVRELDDRVNRWVGVAGTNDERAEVEVRWWWVGLVGYIVMLTLVLVLSALAHVTLGSAAALVPGVFLVFRSGFSYNERMRSLGAQSRFAGLRWRPHESDASTQPMGGSADSG